METTYATGELGLSTDCPHQRPRVRAIIEFIEGDLSRPPVVFPQDGSDEVDARVTEEILKRWEGFS